MFQRVLIEDNIPFAIASFRISECLADNHAQMRFGQGRELKNPTAADQRFVDLEIGVFSGGTHKDHGAIFYPRQQCILLGLVETMHFIDEEDRALLVELGPLLRLGNRFADLLHSRKHGVEGNKVRRGGIGDHLGQRGLAGTGWAIKDQTA
jgi:hypothetical protein